MKYNPELARATAAAIDGLADRLETAVRNDASLLRIDAAGADEVSVASALTLTQVADSYRESAESAVHELRKLAALVRRQADGITEMEQGNSDVLVTAGRFGQSL